MMRLFLFVALACQATAADTSLKLWYRFSQTNNGYILDASGNGNHGLQFNPTNWLRTGVFNGRQAGIWETNVAPANPNMTDDGAFPNGQLIPDSTVPSTGHKYAGGVYLAVTNLTSIQYLTNGTITLFSYHIHKFLNSPTFLVDGAYSAIGQSYTNCWRLIRVNADRLSFRCYSSSTVDSDGDALVLWPQDWVNTGGNTGTDAWHHYAVTFDCPGNKMVAYYDGAPYQTNTLALPPWFRIHGYSGYDWLAIGCANHSGTPQWGDDKYPNDGFLSGGLADLRIYNRTLSAAEISQIYTNTADVGVKTTVSGAPAQITGTVIFQ